MHITEMRLVSLGQKPSKRKSSTIKQEWSPLDERITILFTLISLVLTPAFDTMSYISYDFPFLSRSFRYNDLYISRFSCFCPPALNTTSYISHDFPFFCPAAFDTTSYISHEFPSTANQGDFVCKLTPQDFGKNPATVQSAVFTSIGANVFNVDQ